MSFKWTYQKERLSYYSNAVARRIIKNNISEPKFKRPVLSAYDGNLELKKMIESGLPFAAARYGGTETKTIADVLYTQAGGKFGGISDKTLQRIMNLSGFFPDDKALLNKFTDLYMECSPKLDMLGVWNILLQSYLADEKAVNAKLANLNMFEPYYFANPWTDALRGKRVVVIHPFAGTIEKQYARREELFTNWNIIAEKSANDVETSKYEVLPAFELRTVRAVQTLAGEKDTRFENWFEALEYMYDECMKEDFDIALIGCGAYGLPLAVKIKEAGKQAVHVGGALQLFFGIKGSRWDNHDRISKLYNDSWVRPGDEDKINKSSVVEGSCYW